MGSVKAKEIKIELGSIQDIQALLEKGKQGLKDAQEMQKQLKNTYSRALIILDQNIPAQVDNAIKKANELGADDVVDKLQSLKKQSTDLASDIKPVFNQL